jgi:DNA-binding NarL/FixJ family response regulator
MLQCELGEFMSIRILVADDSPFWREELRALLEQDSCWDVFEAENGSDALRKSSWIKPDVVILDLFMPELDGLSTARALTRQIPAPAMVILTVDKSPFLEAAARECGVLAVFSKVDYAGVRNFLKQTLPVEHPTPRCSAAA